MAVHVRIPSRLFNEPAQHALNCFVRSVPGSFKLASERVAGALCQRLLTHVSVVAIAQGTCGTRPSIRRQAKSECCGHPQLRILQHFRGRFVHGNPCRTSSLPTRTWHDGLLLRRQILVQFGASVTLHFPSHGQLSTVDVVSRLQRCRADVLVSNLQQPQQCANRPLQPEQKLPSGVRPRAVCEMHHRCSASRLRARQQPTSTWPAHQNPAGPP